ncbi:MAG: DotU family type IV/VI secretion system protein [Thiolinea sp.]
MPRGGGSGWGRTKPAEHFIRSRSASGFSRSCRKPGRTRPATSLLELMSVCLAMGFQGDSLEPDGKEKISQIRSWLADDDSPGTWHTGSSLVRHWQGVSTQSAAA